MRALRAAAFARSCHETSYDLRFRGAGGNYSVDARCDFPFTRLPPSSECSLHSIALLELRRRTCVRRCPFLLIQSKMGGQEATNSLSAIYDSIREPLFSLSSIHDIRREVFCCLSSIRDTLREVLCSLSSIRDHQRKPLCCFSAIHDNRREPLRSQPSIRDGVPEYAGARLIIRRRAAPSRKPSHPNIPCLKNPGNSPAILSYLSPTAASR